MRILLKGVVVLKGGENGENALESLVTREVKGMRAGLEKITGKGSRGGEMKKNFLTPSCFQRGVRGLSRRKKLVSFHNLPSFSIRHIHNLLTCGYLLCAVSGVKRRTESR